LSDREKESVNVRSPNGGIYGTRLNSRQPCFTRGKRPSGGLFGEASAQSSGQLDEQKKHQGDR
jgi:hypothetical protein